MRRTGRPPAASWRSSTGSDVVRGEPEPRSDLADAGAVARRRENRRLLSVGQLGTARPRTAGDAGAIEPLPHRLGVELEPRGDLGHREPRGVEGYRPTPVRGADPVRPERACSPAAARAASQVPKRGRTAVGLGTGLGCACRRANLPACPRRQHM